MLDEKFVNAALSKHHQKVDPPAMADPILLQFWFCKAEGYLEKIGGLLGATSEESKTHPFLILWGDYKDNLSKLASSKSLRQYVQNLHGMTEVTNKTMLYLSQEASQFIQDEEEKMVLHNAFQILWEDRIKTTLEDHISTASRVAGNALVVSPSVTSSDGSDRLAPLLDFKYKGTRSSVRTRDQTSSCGRKETSTSSAGSPAQTVKQPPRTRPPHSLSTSRALPHTPRVPSNLQYSYTPTTGDTAGSGRTIQTDE